MNCDLCGKTEERLLKALVEGVELNVCPACGKFGKVIGHVKKEIPKAVHKRAEPEEKIELLVEDYASIIKNKRESMGLNQKEFALRINEKESIVHKIETGSFTPPVSLAKKLEKILGVKITEQHEERHGLAKEKRVEGFTLGDFIKIKR